MRDRTHVAHTGRRHCSRQTFGVGAKAPVKLDHSVSWSLVDWGAGHRQRIAT